MPNARVAAAAGGLPSRRGALAALAGAGAALSLPKLARGADHPDARLFALYAEWQASEAESDKAFAAWSDAEDRTVYPDPPEALFRRDSDWPYFWGWYGTRHEDGRWWYGDAKSLDALRAWPCEGNGLDHPSLVTRRIARRDEILAAKAAWHATWLAARDAGGVTDAMSIAMAAATRASDFRRTIGLTRAATVGGLLVKLRIAHACHAGWAEKADEHLAKGDASDEAMIASAMRDLVALDAQAQGGLA